MNTGRVRLLGLVGILVAVGLFAAPAVAQPMWDGQKGNCEPVFMGYEQASLPELKFCMGIWESYRDVSQLNDGQKQFMAKVFDRLRHEGDEPTRHMAKGAMSRLGFAPAEEAPVAGKTADGKSSRKKYRPHTATPEEQKAAEKIRQRGAAQLKRHGYSEAAADFNEALEHDPASVQALYDGACATALAGDAPKSIEFLRRLSDMATKPSIEKLHKARVDKDFESMRDDPEYKRATGYAKIKVMNGMPADDRDLGDDQVFKLVELLRNPKLSWVVDQAEVADKHARDRPHIWYKEPSKNQAYVLMKVLGHPKTRLVPLDWDSPYDLIVSWADKVEINKDGDKYVKYPMNKKGSGSLDPEKRMDEAVKAEDDALKDPDEYARKAQHVLETPDRVTNKVDSATDKVNNTVNTMEKVGDKAGKLFGK